VLAACALVLAWGGAWHAAGASHALAPWRASSLRFWFDKCCIDQRHAASKQAGIDHLGDSLSRSRHMVVIFSDVYLTRMWCTYELATYCKLMRDEAPDAERKRSVVFLSLSWEAWWNRRNLLRPAALSGGEAAALARYSCRAARVYSRRDKAEVLGLIREAWWGSEDACDEYVRTQLPAILLEGKRAYFSQFRTVAWTSFLLLFG
jgi:hypothetical protein